MAKLITGILAHVDAGKTTLSEALLYHAGAIRKLGRVDSKDAFLDNDKIEKERGITIFSKQAQLNEKITLIDTPGHVDFAAEMERTLSVLDAAILLINASDGIQSHTKTLWSLLNQHKIPTVIFVNKMDMPDTNREQLLAKLKHGLSENVVDFSKAARQTADFFEQVAAGDDVLTEMFLNGQTDYASELPKAISRRTVFPCIFGSALKMQGVEELFSILNDFVMIPEYDSGGKTSSAASSPVAAVTPNLAASSSSAAPSAAPFGCIVYKISKDKQGNRLTHLKVTGGVLKVKAELEGEKANEIRIYSGEKWEGVKEVAAGEVCTVTGLKNSFAGKTYGAAVEGPNTRLEPALIYSVIPPQDVDTTKMLHVLREVEEELPEIMVEYSEATKEIYVKLMGQVQTEVIQQLLLERYNISISFGEGRIAYKETIQAPVIGVGHYEPLKHYAEVHLKMSPLPLGSGLRFFCNLSVDVLDTNWQRLILTHLKEKTHLGVLTGSPITDMSIEVVAGRAHLKHTEGGDFRQATYRAVRHGLMYATSILLEPVYSYEIVVPDICTGRVMNDMEKMQGTCTLEESKAGFATLSGRVPVSTIKNYMNEVRAYTKGQGTLSLTLDGYQKCHNQEEVIKQLGYNPDADFENQSSSVFCSHGAGFNVFWDKVNDYKHIK